MFAISIAPSAVAYFAQRATCLFYFVVVVIWGLLPQFLGLEASVQWGLPSFALIVLGLLWFRQPQTLWPLFQFRWSFLFLGASVGLMMVGATYFSFSLLSPKFPSLFTRVAQDYAPLRALNPWLFLPRMLCVIVTEECLFRGVLLDTPVKTKLWPPLLSMMAYLVAQFGLDSWAVYLAALGCGLCWLWLRLYTHNLWAPLVAHVIWSPTVLLFFPLVPH